MKHNETENQKGKEAEKRNVGVETVRLSRSGKSEDKDKEIER